MSVQRQPDLLSANEAIALLQISRSTLTNLVRRGKITPANPRNPALQRPARLLFRRADVERLNRPVAQAS